MKAAPNRDEQILQRLLSLQPGKIDLGLDRVSQAIRECCAVIPFRVVLIGGTNGKGSTGAFLEQIALSSGFRTGLYTSPHLESIRERFRIGGKWVSPVEFEEGVDQVFAWMEQTGTKLTFFEAMTVVAVIVFAKADVQIGIFEVGLGGRLDATNALEPDVSVLTNVGLDHMEWLGDDLHQIAWEKGGITRPHIPLVTGLDARLLDSALRDREQPSVIRRFGSEFSVFSEPLDGRVFKHGSSHFFLPSIGLEGEHQWSNAALAVETALMMGFEPSQEQLLSALNQVHHPGRIERFGHEPEFLLDGAHNGPGAEGLARFLEQNQVLGKTVFIVAVKAPRDPETLISHWRHLADSWIIHEVEGVPMVECEVIEASLKSENILRADGGNMVSTLTLAAKEAGEQGRVVIAGSLYLVGAARKSVIELTERPQSQSPLVAR